MDPTPEASEPPLPPLDPEAARLLEAARRGEPVERRLTVAGLQPGDVGVLEARVLETAAPRTFRRRDGREGVLCRVRLADATGEVDLVLWGDELRHARGGPLAPGNRVLLRGPTVRPGYRGGVELHLGAAVLEAAGPEEGQADACLEGRILEVGPARPVGDPPAVRFTADAVLETRDGTVHVVLWDGLVKEARAVRIGSRIRFSGLRLHPSLEGWWIADGGAALQAGPDAVR